MKFDGNRGKEKQSKFERVALSVTGDRPIAEITADDLGAIIAEITLVDHPVLVDDEGHDATFARFCGSGDKPVSGDQVAIDPIIMGAALGVRSLSRKNAGTITLIGLAGLAR